jgi:hypothetical protein
MKIKLFKPGFLFIFGKKNRGSNECYMYDLKGQAK